MLERHFRSFKTIDRIRALWLGPEIERYVDRLDEVHTSEPSVRQHIQVLVRFDSFAHVNGVNRLEELPQLIDPFVDEQLKRTRYHRKSYHHYAEAVSTYRSPVHRMLRTVLPSYTGKIERLAIPFADNVPGYLEFLSGVCGLSKETLRCDIIQLRFFERYLKERNIDLHELSPDDIAKFVIERAKSLSKNSTKGSNKALRSFLRYAYKERYIGLDLEFSIPRVRNYVAAKVMRSIPWSDVEKLIKSIDRRSDCGKRDFAIITLIASYALRAREIAALQPDNINWDASQLRVPLRKAGHSTVYPLSASAGNALIDDYFTIRRRDTPHRQLFLTVRSPYTPLGHHGVASMVGVRLKRAGVIACKPGSHTLRHACVQHLIEADLPFKVIADYVGHRSTESTLGYGKVSLKKLRELVSSDDETTL